MVEAVRQIFPRIALHRLRPGREFREKSYSGEARKNKKLQGGGEDYSFVIWAKCCPGGAPASPLGEGPGGVLPVAAGAAGPGLQGMAEEGGEPADGPEAGGAAGEQGVAPVAETGAVEEALASAAFAFEFTL
jgi:hypothetical protein